MTLPIPGRKNLASDYLLSQRGVAMFLLWHNIRERVIIIIIIINMFKQHSLVFQYKKALEFIWICRRTEDGTTTWQHKVPTNLTTGNELTDEKLWTYFWLTPHLFLNKSAHALITYLRP